jgi:phosphoribosylformylglycinamidine synthase
LSGEKILKSAHDISDGGISVAIAECCILKPGNEIGAKINLQYNYRKDFELFGETQSRIIISINKKDILTLTEKCKKFEIPYTEIGFTGGQMLEINNDIRLGLPDLKENYFNSLSKYLN